VSYEEEDTCVNINPNPKLSSVCGALALLGHETSVCLYPPHNMTHMYPPPHMTLLVSVML